MNKPVPFFSDETFANLQEQIAAEAKPMLISPNILKAVADEYAARGLELPQGLVATIPVPNETRKIMIGFM